VHVAAPTDPEYVPTAHGVAALAAAGQYEPAGQSACVVSAVVGDAQ
jgi:hypothetical protein